MQDSESVGRIVPRVFYRRTAVTVLFVVVSLIAVVGCAPKPLIGYTTDTPPMVLTPASNAGIADDRARFREIYCAVTEAHGHELPDYRPCDEVLVRLANEAPASGVPVALGPGVVRVDLLVVPGLGWNCFEQFVDPRATVQDNLARYGYSVRPVPVEGLSSGARNAKLIRDYVMAMPEPEAAGYLVLVGYSKGTPDILEALTRYAELGSRVTAVVSIAGAVGGSPLANEAAQSTANLLVHFPGSECDKGDEGAVEDLKTSVRRRWLASHQLPESIRYYSLVTYPAPEQISTALKPGYNKLSQVDTRNDSQVIFYDQIIPNSTLLGYLNADHWAVAVPVGRSSPIIAVTLVDRNRFPREVLLEALVRYLEEDLGADN